MELGHLVKPHDMELALAIFQKVGAAFIVVQCLSEMNK